MFNGNFFFFNKPFLRDFCSCLHLVCGQCTCVIVVLAYVWWRWRDRVQILGFFCSFVFGVFFVLALSMWLWVLERSNVDKKLEDNFRILLWNFEISSLTEFLLWISILDSYCLRAVKHRCYLLWSTVNGKKCVEVVVLNFLKNYRVSLLYQATFAPVLGNMACYYLSFPHAVIMLGWKAL